MSIGVDNNLKIAENKELFEQRAHYMPCKIDENGSANVNKYFEPYVAETGNSGLSGSFRGRPLNGVKMDIREGHRAVIVNEAKRPLSEDADRKFQVVGGFKEVVYWNWDKQPSKNDPLSKAMDWIDISEAVKYDLTHVKRAPSAGGRDMFAHGV